MGMSPTVHFQDDMQTLVASGTLVAADLENHGIGYINEHYADDTNTITNPQLGSLSVGNGEALRVSLFSVKENDMVELNFCSPTGDGAVTGRFLTYYMTFTVNSEVFKAEMVMADNDDTSEPFTNYMDTVTGFYAALDAHRTATITFDAPDTRFECIE